MTAKIIAANREPFVREQVDTITLDIIENALRNARTEMDATLIRTAMSPGIREQGDAFPLIADRDGKMVVGQFGSFIDGFLRSFDGEIEEGDVIWLSDPYACEGAVSHSNDWLIIRPIYRAGRLIAWASMFGHQTDIGGKVPGSMPTDSTSIFEEGIRIPPIKLYKKDILQEDILKLVLHQVRMPEWCRADLHAIVASCRVAEKRIHEICTRFGDTVFTSATDELLARNKKAMAHLFATAVSETPVSFTDYVCDDGRGFGPYAIKCSMWRKPDGGVVLDFEGTDPQAAGSINFFLNENMLKMFFGIYMIMVFDPQVLFNDGFYDLVEVRIPERSLLKPAFPAALSCRTHALGRLFDVLGALLGQGQPEFLNAAGFSSSPHLMFSGFEKNSGDWFQLFQIGFGGIPGRPFGDGPDGHSLWPGFTNVPNEFLERYFPLRITRYTSVPDSGGAGLHRGGNGILMTYEFLNDGVIAIHDDRWFMAPWGVNGGAPGERSRKILRRANGEITRLPAKCDNIDVHEGDQLDYITWGGGGWGDALARNPDLVAREVKQGLVSEAGALKNYGVVLNRDGSVDTARTQEARTKMRERRPQAEIFNFGDDMETRRAKSLVETGFEAPVEPKWPKVQAEI